MKQVHHKYRVAGLSDGKGGIYAAISNSKQDAAELKLLPNFLGWVTGRRGFSFMLPEGETK